jgi:hypothetical protein
VIPYTLDHFLDSGLCWLSLNVIKLEVVLYFVGLFYSWDDLEIMGDEFESELVGGVRLGSFTRTS